MSCYSGSVEACLVSNVIEGADDEEPFVEARTDWRDPKEYTHPPDTMRTPTPIQPQTSTQLIEEVLRKHAHVKTN